MKKFLLLFAFFIISINLIAQTPNGISYQAIVRDSDQNLILDSQVSVRVSIIQTTVNGNIVFSEVHNPNTNSNGLISIVIGRGGQQTGDFTTIDWANGPFFVKTEIDPSAGSEYNISSTTQLLSVPYAFYAKSAGTAQNAFSGDYDDLINAPDLDEFAKKDMQNQNIINLGNPADEQDATNKIYVDNLIRDLRDRIQHLEDHLDLGPPPVEDIDGNVYQTVRIGNQLWMAENLRVTHYANGDPIPNLESDETWANAKGDGFAWFDNNYETWGEAYGALYNWHAVIHESGICPEGWRTAKELDWIDLVNYLDNESDPTQWPESQIAGGKMKSTRMEPEDSHPRWTEPNGGATNESGFSGLPGGWRAANGLFHAIGTTGFWWVATQSPTGAWYRSMASENPYLYRSAGSLNAGMSLRCIKY